MGEVETELRATLAEVEAAAPAPRDLADRLINASTDPHQAARRDAHRRSRRRWLPPALAAVAVIAIAAGVTFGVGVTGSTPPVHPKPTTGTTQPAPPSPSDTLTSLRCITALPSAWKRSSLGGTVIAAPSLLYGDVAVNGAGDLISVQYTSSRAYKVVLLAPDAPIRSLYRTPPGQPSPEQAIGIRSVGVEGTWVAFTTVGGGHRAQIILINLATGARTIVRTIPAGVDMLGDARVIADGALDSGLRIAGGALYWSEIQTQQRYGRLYRYDIGTGQHRVLDTRAASGPLASTAGAVYWERRGAAGSKHGKIESWPAGAFTPAGVAWDARPALLAGPDGIHVWQDVSGAIKAEQPGGASGPVTIVAARRGWHLERAIGDFVWTVGPGGTTVTDLRTGAASRWDVGDQVPGGTANTAVFDRAGGFTVVDASKLPALRC